MKNRPFDVPGYTNFNKPNTGHMKALIFLKPFHPQKRPPPHFDAKKTSKTRRLNRGGLGLSVVGRGLGWLFRHWRPSYVVLPSGGTG